MDFVQNFCQQFKDESKAQKAQEAALPQGEWKRPKRALTPYLLFAADQRKELPNMQICNQMKEIGKRWNVLTHIQKSVYEQKARLDKDRYEEEMSNLPKGLPPSAMVGQKRQRCRRAKKDPNKPKKVLSPYILFVKEQRPEFTKNNANKDKTFVEIMRALGDMWKNLPAVEKQKYFTMSEEDRERFIKDSEKYEREEETRKMIPVVHIAKDGMPKKPLSAYLLFAQETRDLLRRKQPNASVSDIMKAISIDWAKLDKPKKRDYFETARRNRRQYYMLQREWTSKHGPKVSGAKQLKELEERRKKSIVNFLTHGQDFNTAAMFGQQKQEGSLTTETIPDSAAMRKELEPSEENPEEVPNLEEGASADEDEENDEMDEAKQREIQEFLEKREYETEPTTSSTTATTNTMPTSSKPAAEPDFDPADVY